MTTNIEAILHDLHELARTARDAGMAITWYEPHELRGLHVDVIEDVMTAAANEFIELNALAIPMHQLSLDIGTDA